MSIWEEAFTSLIRIFIYFIMIIVVMAAMLFLYNVNSVNDYIAQCNAIVARSGGLTHRAYDKCQQYSYEYYHNYYHVSVHPNQTYSDTESKGDIDVKATYKTGTNSTSTVTLPADSDSVKNGSYQGHKITATKFQDVNASKDNAADYEPNRKEAAFGKVTPYYIYSKVPFLRSLPDIPKIYYGTHDKPAHQYSGNPAHRYNGNDGENLQRRDLDGNNNGTYDNVGSDTPIEEDVHSLIRAGSQN